MKLENRFDVPVGAELAWQVLMDVERVVPCMPGAALTGHDGDDFTGTIKVKVGPVTFTYGGSATFVSKDSESFTAILSANARETRGSGTAKATITCRLQDEGDHTKVDVETDLAITGKAAQFGKGVLADVSGRLIDQFAACLAAEIAPSDTSTAASAARPEISPRSDDATVTGGPVNETTITEGTLTEAADAVNLLGVAAKPIITRLLPVLGVVAVLLVLLLTGRRKRRPTRH